MIQVKVVKRWLTSWQRLQLSSGRKAMRGKILLGVILAGFTLIQPQPVSAVPFIDFNASVVATDGSGPVLICIPSSGAGPCQEAGGNFRPDALPFYAFKNLDNGSGTATAISGLGA